MATTKTSTVRLTQLKGAPSNPNQLVIASHGKQRTGKTHFAATLPSTVGIVPLDRNTRWTMAREIEASGKRAIIPETDFIRAAAELGRRNLPEDKSIDAYRRHLDAIKDALYQMYEDDKVAAVCIDTGTDMWESILFAYFGRTSKIMPRDRGAANSEMVTLLNMCGKHLLVTHRSTEIWANDKPTGTFKLSGYAHISYCVTVCVEHYRLTDGDVFEMRRAIKKGDAEFDAADVEEGQFAMRVFDCQARPALKGGLESVLLGDRCTFQDLGVLVFPDSEREDWE